MYRGRRDERGRSTVFSLLFELELSRDASRNSHHGVVDLSGIGLLLAMSGNVKTIPVVVPSSSSLCCIAMLALSASAASFFLPSQNAVEASPKRGASYLIGSQSTALPAVTGAIEAKEAGLPAGDRLGGVEAERWLARGVSK